MVAWFAELFYIFRLFVYHVKFKEKEELREIYKVMEYRLIYFIGHPSMALTVILGFWMLAKNPALIETGWLPLKLLLVFFVIGYQIFISITQRRFAKNDFFLSEKACRIINEVPTILLIGIVLLVVLRPSF